MINSYSSESRGLTAFLRENIGNYQAHTQDVAGHVRRRIEDAKRVESRICKRFAIELRDLDMLEIGPGQFLTQLAYFAVQNRATGIDRDVIVRGYNPLAFVRMLSVNGVRRTLKTIGRKMMGIDRNHVFHLMTLLGLQHYPPITMHVMDSCDMSFPSESFDFVYSRAVFQVLPNPRFTIDEIVRVLRPGGVAYISIQPYTSETGCLDPRINTSRHHETLGWPHLRPKLQKQVQAPNTYLNKFRLANWRDLFDVRMIGVEYVLEECGSPDTITRARELRRQGELADYSLEELTTGEFAVLWRKPPATLSER